MADSPEIEVTYTFAEPIDLEAALERLEPLGTESLPITDSRVVTIFRGGILDVESPAGPLGETSRLAISVFELPEETEADDPTAAARTLMTDFVERVTASTETAYEVDGENLG